jgi:hypothetical protein
MASTFRCLIVGFMGAACGGVLDQGAGGGGAGAIGGASPTAQGGSGGAGGESAGNELPPGADLVAISPAERERMTVDACVGSWVECDSMNESVALVVDLSSSMTLVAPGNSRTSWELVRDGLRAAIAKALPVNELGLQFFPNQAAAANLSTHLPASACINSADDLVLGPTPFWAIDSALARVEPNPAAGAPIQDAYRQALDTFPPTAQPISRYVVLVTDGHPTFELGCFGTGTSPVDPGPIIDDIAQAYQAGVSTLVVGAPGSADARSWLSRAARAGGTAAPGCTDQDPQYCHIDMTAEPDLGLALFRWFAVPCFAPACSWVLPPPPPDVSPNLERTMLLYRNSTGTYFVQRAPTDSATCSRGWHFSADGREVHLCHDTCDTVESTYGTISLLLLCDTLQPVF